MKVTVLGELVSSSHGHRGCCQETQPMRTSTNPLILAAVAREGQEQGSPCANWCPPLRVNLRPSPPGGCTLTILGPLQSIPECESLIQARDSSMTSLGRCQHYSCTGGGGWGRVGPPSFESWVILSRTLQTLASAPQTPLLSVLSQVDLCPNVGQSGRRWTCVCLQSGFSWEPSSLLLIQIEGARKPPLNQKHFAF